VEEQTIRPESMGEMGRMTGIIWEPKPVFENLAARPRWWAPIILLTIMAVVFMTAFNRRVGIETFMRQQMDRQFQTNPQMAQMNAEQRERMLGLYGAFAKYGLFAAAAVGTTFSTLLTAAIMLGIMNLLGSAGLKFQEAFSVTSYSFMPSAISSVLAMVVMLLKNPEDFDLQNALPANLGAFLSVQTTPKWLHALAASFDLFTFWIMLLMALGFSVFAKRLSFGKSLTLVLIPWALYVLIFRVALAGLQG
jgi:hypothetical protein